jgi:hypothetical protein
MERREREKKEDLKTVEGTGKKDIREKDIGRKRNKREKRGKLKLKLARRN